MANCVYVMARMLHFYKFTISRHCRHEHELQSASDWLNLHSLGTMSAFGYIENLA